MRRSRNFRPGTDTAGLEGRVLLSTAAGRLHRPPAAYGTLHNLPRSPEGYPGWFGRISRAFDEFTGEYLAAANLFNVSGQNSPYASTITSLTNSLSQELSTYLMFVPARGVRGQPSPYGTVQAFLQTQLTTILGATGMLGTLTVQAVPPAGTSPALLPQYTQIGTSAIATAKASLFNAVRFAASGAVPSSTTNTGTGTGTGTTTTN